MFQIWDALGDEDPTGFHLMLKLIVKKRSKFSINSYCLKFCIEYLIIFQFPLQHWYGMLLIEFVNGIFDNSFTLKRKKKSRSLHLHWASVCVRNDFAFRSLVFQSSCFVYSYYYLLPLLPLLVLLFFPYPVLFFVLFACFPPCPPCNCSSSPLSSSCLFFFVRVVVSFATAYDERGGATFTLLLLDGKKWDACGNMLLATRKATIHSRALW